MLIWNKKKKRTYLENVCCLCTYVFVLMVVVVVVVV